MIDPGFSPGGLRSHAATSGSFVLKMPPANVVRDQKWVRFGPILPCETPPIVWQPAQPFELNSASPADASLPSAGVAAFCFWSASHVSNFAGDTAMARLRMLACEA